MSNYIIKDGYSEMDFDRVTDLLKDTFWCKGIKRDEVIKGAQNSALLVGTFAEDNKQIGFARVISDKTRFAYIMDVIVDENYRKRGIGQLMMNHILNHDDLKTVYQWLLVTKDAHGVYKKVGFNPVNRPNDWMEIMYKRSDKIIE